MTLTGPVALRFPCPNCRHARGWHDGTGCAYGGCRCGKTSADIETVLQAVTPTRGPSALP